MQIWRLFAHVSLRTQINFTSYSINSRHHNETIMSCLVRRLKLLRAWQLHSRWL